MAFLRIQAPTFISLILIVLGLPAAASFLLFGIAQLIHPDVPVEYLGQNTVACLVLIALGTFLLLMAVAAFRGLLHKWRSTQSGGA